MNILPAIYLMQGKCVHPSGPYLDQYSIFSDDPIDRVGRWMDAGVQELYLFDVEGAAQGKTLHQELIIAIAQRFPNLILHVEGGVRIESDLEAYLQSGLKSVTLGTQALEDPAFVAEMCKRFPGCIKVSLNLLDGRVHTHGGQKESSLSAELCWRITLR